MQSIKVDRTDLQYAIGTDKEKKYFAIELSELPKPVKKGDIILIDDNGKITVKS
ncbi:MAG: DUF3006 domain-containing protein [Acutalibacteraceae bacterium]